MQSWLEGRIWVGKGAQATGWLQAWEYCQAKLIQTLGRASQGVDWSWSQCIKSHHTQTSSGKGLPSHFWTKTSVRSVLPGLWRKELDCCSVVQSPLSDESKFAFHLETRSRVWGRVERHRFHVAWSPVWSFHSQWWLGCHVICWCWSTVFFWSPQSTQPSTRKFLEHFMLPSADKLYGYADSFSAGLGTCPHCQGYKSWFSDHGVTVLDWPANSPDLNPIENLWGIVKRKMRDTRPNNVDELKATVKETWASIPPQQCHKLITSMPRRIEAVIKAKGAPTKYWVHTLSEIKVQNLSLGRYLFKRYTFVPIRF